MAQANALIAAVLRNFARDDGIGRVRHHPMRGKRVQQKIGAIGAVIAGDVDGVKAKNPVMGDEFQHEGAFILHRAQQNVAGGLGHLGSGHAGRKLPKPAPGRKARRVAPARKRV